MRRNKRLPLLAGVLIILLLAAGCGSKAPETEDEGPSWPAQETLKTVDASDIKSITYTRNTEGGGISETVTDADDIEDIYLRLLNLSIKDDTAEGVDDDQAELEVRAGSKTLSFEFEGDVLVLESGSRYKVDQLDMLISCLDKITAEIEEEEDDTGWSYDSGSDEDFDILDGYDISLIDRNGRPVKIKGTAGIRITLPYGGIDRNENTFALYHNDSVAGIEKMTCTADEAGIVFVGHRFSAYTFIASPKASGEGGDDTTSSGGDTTPSGGDTTPSGGDTTPSAEGTIPSGDDTTSSEGDTTSSTGDGTSNKGNTPDTGESSGYVVVTYLLLMLSLGGMAAVYYLRRQGFPGGNDDMYSDSMKQ